MILAIHSPLKSRHSRFFLDFSVFGSWRYWVVGLIAVFTLLGWPQRSFAQGDDTVSPAPDDGASEAEPEEPSGDDVAEEQSDSEEPAAAPPERGIVRVVLFVDDLPLSGAEVSFEGSTEESAITDGDGAAQLSVSESGVMRLVVRAPRGALPEAQPGEGLVEVESQEIELVLGETVEVLVTLSREGKVLSFEAEGVASSVKEEREASAASSDANLPRGTVRGRVLDSEKNQPVTGARVYVRGSAAEATTDAEGKFSLELPEGPWTLSVIHPDFTTTTQPDVVVLADEAKGIDFHLLPASTELEDFVITVPHVEGSVASVLSERRESSAMSDAISAEDISRTPAGDAAGAAQRIVGVTVVDGKFVYVRGLGERYTNSLLNGSPLPSPEPDKATVPLDLLPTQVIRSIDIAKTATPDYPADFAGGSVRIETITVPEEPIFSIALKTGYNSQSTFRKRAAFPGSSTDWLGFDSGMRQLPDEVPRDYPVRNGTVKPDGERLRREEMDEIGQNMNNAMGPHERRNLPNLGGSVIWGNGWDLAKDARLGALASLTYSRKPSLREETIREFNFTGDGDTLGKWIDAKGMTATDTVRWGAFGSIGLEFAEHHEISLVGLRSQIADDTTRVMGLFLQNNDGRYESIRNEYMSRSLEYSQLRGVHMFPALNEGEFDWRLSLSRAILDQPDMRDVVYFRAAGNENYVYSTGTGSGRHFFSDMTENARSAFADYTQPLVLGDLEKKLKVGGGINRKDRVFTARRFSFALNSRAEDQSAATCGPVFEPYRCPGELFTDENIDGSLLQIQEDTQPTDAYSSRTEIVAGYLLADFKLFKPLRVIGGVRVEKTDQAVSGYNQFDPDDDEGFSDVSLESTDWLPSGSVIYTLTKWLELRGAVSRTLARPQLREMAPFQFADYVGGVLVNGNRNLQMTKIDNADLRIDAFPSPEEVVSLSVFVKDFTAPIEPVVLPAGGSQYLQTYQNAEGAFLYGMEIEARKKLDFMSPMLQHFGVMGNLTLATSQIELSQTSSVEGREEGFMTNTSRPMVNQAPYVVNFALDYDGPSKTQARLLYNVSGKSIVAIGTNGLPDTYLQSRPMLDFTLTQGLTERLQVGMSAENLLNSLYIVTQGPEKSQSIATRSYRSGVSIGVQLGYAL